MDKAKELIRVANECGADLIKGQAFVAQDIRSGSMPLEFYSMCQLEVEQYLELIDYARSIGTDLFYSIFSRGFERLSLVQNWHKIAGSQTKTMGVEKFDDEENVLISVPKDMMDMDLPRLKKSEVLFVSPYFGDKSDLAIIDYLSERVGRQVGYSDHIPGIQASVDAYKIYGSTIIEKHFTLDKGMKFKEQVFRDTVHAADPFELEVLANVMKG